MDSKLDVVTTHGKYTELCKKALRKIARPIRHWDFPNWETVDWPRVAKHSGNVLIIAPLADLPTNGKSVSFPAKRRFLLFTDGMPAEALPSRIAALHIRDEKRLHIAHIQEKTRAAQLIRRVLRGQVTPDHQPILDAWWENGNLVVLAASFERLTIPRAELLPLVGKDLDSFEIDPDGSFLHWPSRDVHLGWQQFQQMVDPFALVRAKARSRQFLKRYGTAIRKVREKQNLRQTDVLGLTGRQVGRIERGMCTLTTSAISKLAQAHRLNMKDYLAAVARQL